MYYLIYYMTYIWLNSATIRKLNWLIEKNNLIYSKGNGKLTFAEYAAHSIDHPMQQQLFNHFDTNKDRFLTKAELVDKTFNAMNVNGRCFFNHQIFNKYIINFIHYYELLI